MADTKQTDFLGMSDEELLNFDPSTLVNTSGNQDDKSTDDETKDTVTDENVDANADTDEEGDKDEADTADDSKDDGDEEGEADGTKDDEGTSATSESSVDDKDGKDTKADVTTNKDGDKKDETTEADKATDAGSPVDYEAAYKQLTAPFKANGKDVQVKSVEDAIALMQMGANYAKKMAGLKPNLKLMKMLESNGLLNEEKLSFLIDLDKKNPEAINKLVMDSKIDPLDLSAEKAGGYKPGTYTVDERAMELDSVIDELKDSPHINRTLNVVGTKWDGASKEVIASTPELIKVINAHMENGVYDLIAQEMESERTFGRLKGLTDIEAYKQIGDAIEARGGFTHLFKGSSPEPKKAPAAPVVVTTKSKQVDESKLREKRRAASSTKTAVTNSAPAADFNPLSLSDDDFKNFKL